MTEGEKYCYNCIHNEVCQWQPREYCDFKENAQPVKCGKWILHTEQIVDVDIKLPTECSECGFEEFSAEKYKFCPECGAKMVRANDN